MATKPKTAAVPNDPCELSKASRRKIALGLFLVPVFYGVLLILALGCLAAAGGLAYLVLDLFVQRGGGRLFAYLLALPTAATFLAAVYMFRALFLSLRKPPRFVPAVWVNPAREPDLTRFLQGLCKDTGAVFPNGILLSVGTEFFVTRYKMTVLNANPSGYILCMSLPLLSVLTVNELRAIVAHEFAHFSGGDVRYGNIVRPVFIAIVESMRMLLQRMRMHQYDVFSRLALIIPLQVLRFYLFLFAKLDTSLSRDMERRSDAVASRVCGKATFGSAMRKIVGYSGAFHEVFPGIMEELRVSKEADINGYRTFRKRLKDYQAIAQRALAGEMVEYSDAWETHPTLIKRLEGIPPYPERYSDQGPALALFKQYQGYEQLAHQYMYNEYQIYLRETRR